VAQNRRVREAEAGQPPSVKKRTARTQFARRFGSRTTPRPLGALPEAVFARAFGREISAVRIDILYAERRWGAVKKGAKNKNE
jgi:hypothetical protein